MKYMSNMSVAPKLNLQNALHHSRDTTLQYPQKKTCQTK